MRSDGLLAVHSVLLACDSQGCLCNVSACVCMRTCVSARGCVRAGARHSVSSGSHRVDPALYSPPTVGEAWRSSTLLHCANTDMCNTDRFTQRHTHTPTHTEKATQTLHKPISLSSRAYIQEMQNVIVYAAQQKPQLHTICTQVFNMLIMYNKKETMDSRLPSQTKIASS